MYLLKLQISSIEAEAQRRAVVQTSLKAQWKSTEGIVNLNIMIIQQVSEFFNKWYTIHKYFNKPQGRNSNVKYFTLKLKYKCIRKNTFNILILHIVTVAMDTFNFQLMNLNILFTWTRNVIGMIYVTSFIFEIDLLKCANFFPLLFIKQ